MAKRKSAKVTAQKVEQEVNKEVVEETLLNEEAIAEEPKEVLVEREDIVYDVPYDKPICETSNDEVVRELTTDEKEDIRLVSRLEKAQEDEFVGLTPSTKKQLGNFLQVDTAQENNNISDEHTIYDGQVPTSKHVELGRRFGYAWNGIEYEY